MGQKVLGDGVFNILGDQGPLGACRDNTLNIVESQTGAEVSLIKGGQVLAAATLDLNGCVGSGRRFDCEGQGEGDGESAEVAEGGLVVVVGWVRINMDYVEGEGTCNEGYDVSDKEGV
jgi:hypothetical protein